MKTIHHVCVILVTLTVRYRIPYQSRNNTFFRKHRINVLANTNEWILQDMNYYITSYSDFHDDDTKPRMFE